MSGAQQLIELRFPACTEQLRDVRDVVRKTLESQDCRADFIASTVLAVDEATVNVIRHAYKEGESGEVILQIARDNDRLIFRLIDFAAPIDQATIKPRNLGDIRPGGLGVHIIREIMDTMEFVQPPQGAGNALEMTKKLF
jgi:sigma-B regulation protein RsbU (phosphoserine phosphatase)